MAGTGKGFVNRSSAIVLTAAIVVWALAAGCEFFDTEPRVTPTPVGTRLTNPAIPEGEGADEKVRWQNYPGKEEHGGRKTAIKWPNALYATHGCRPENTRCFVDGSEYFFYQVETYPSGAKILSYGSPTRDEASFRGPFVAVLFKDGRPFCAVEIPDATANNALVKPPATIALPDWVSRIR